MTADEKIAAVERDRVRRERELLLILLLIASQSRRYAIHAVKLGLDPIAAIRSTWLGSPHFRGLPVPLSRVMADSHIAGFRRFAAMVGTQTPAPDTTALARYYGPQAQQASEQMASTLAERVTGDLAGVDDPKEIIVTINKSFMDGGYTVDNPTALVRGAELPVVQSGNDGAANAMQQPDARHFGFRHYSVLDKGTTRICRERDLLTLPAGDAYWLNNWPSLHFGCRSVVLPWMSDGPWSTSYPTTPPAEGFGRMPIYHPDYQAVAA